MDGFTTERSFDSLATCVIGVLGLFFAMFAMGVCTTRHWQTSGRLVQELNVCTVHKPELFHIDATGAGTCGAGLENTI